MKSPTAEYLTAPFTLTKFNSLNDRFDSIIKMEVLHNGSIFLVLVFDKFKALAGCLACLAD